MITARGRKLASELNSYIGTTQEILEICSKIGRLAATHHRIAEIECSIELSPKQAARLEKRVEQIERKISDHCSRLPHTDEGPIRVRFDGDPRGYTVKLIVPGQPQAGNTWGLGGEFGV